jgi:hypothetical protein
MKKTYASEERVTRRDLRRVLHFTCKSDKAEVRGYIVPVLLRRSNPRNNAILIIIQKKDRGR